MQDLTPFSFQYLTADLLRVMSAAISGCGMGA